jgi:hypothetical protein
MVEDAETGTGNAKREDGESCGVRATHKLPRSRHVISLTHQHHTTSYEMIIY